jgi:hypothetical protein
MTDLDTSHAAVVRLVTDFESHRRAYMAHSDHEQELRADFLNKFYTSLGWDVDHAKQKIRLNKR